MSRQRMWLIGFYALVAIAALITTWGQNVAYLGDGLVGAFQTFASETRVNPASRSITVDLGFFVLAAAAFMVIEARRLGVRFVWLYIVAGFLIAISFAFPLFMIARELRLGKGEPEAAWSLTIGDLAGLALITAVIMALIGYVLS